MRLLIITVLSALALFTGALAQQRTADELRKIDFSAKIIDQNGEPVPECLRNKDRFDPSKGCGEWGDLTLGHIAMMGLNQADGTLRAEDLTRRIKLGLKVLDAKELELGIDEIKLIKDQVEKLGQPQQRLGGAALYSPLVIYRAQQLLDPVGAK